MEGSGTLVDSSRICFALDLSATDNSQPVGIQENLSIISNFAKYVAPELGWVPADQGLPTGYPID